MKNFFPNQVGGVVIYVSFCFSIRSLIRPVMATTQVFFRGSVLVPYRTSLAVSLIIIIRGEEGGRNSGHKRRRRNKRHSRQSARATHRWYLTIIHYNLLFYVSKGLSAQVNEWVMDEQPDRNLHAITDWLAALLSAAFVVGWTEEITFGTYPHFTSENMSVVAFWMQFISEWLQIKLILNLTKHDVLMQWGFHRSLSRSSTTHVCKLISLRELNPNSTNSY